jgi:hypothetical protein
MVARTDGAPEAREGSETRVRPERRRRGEKVARGKGERSEHAAPGSPKMTIPARRADRNGSTRESVAPPGLTPFIKIDPGAARFALAPGYLLAAPSALDVFAPMRRLRR